MSWTAQITIQNKSNTRFRYKIKKGQVFENKRTGTGLQNVVAIKDYVFEIQPNATETVLIEVLCLNEKLKPPSGNYNLTNFMVDKDFQTQQDLWAIMSAK
jgi:hypothetical protein